MKDYAIFLGTGSSLGVPLIGCSCEVCFSNNPKNKRFRSSLFLEIGGKKLVIDTGPDFRSQMLANGITGLDGVIYTHSHHDHVAGIDDLRVFAYRRKASIPCLASEETASDLEKRYDFMFKSHGHEPGEFPRARLVRLKDRSGVVTFEGIKIRYFSYVQTGMQVLGIRIGSFAYVTDIKEYNEQVFKELLGVQTLVISALRFTASSMHLTVDEAVDFARKIGCNRAYFTHISHDIDHDKANACLPSGIELAYDGLKIPL